MMIMLLYLEYLTKKIASQPLKSYNAGCTFKNPLNQSAWKLIREHANNLQFNNSQILNIAKKFDLVAIRVDTGLEFDKTECDELQKFVEDLGVEYVVEKTEIADDYGLSYPTRNCLPS